MQVFLIINLFLYSFSVIPIWNLKNSSIDLLKDKTSYEYVITNRSMYDLQAKLTKKITKEEDGTITHENTLNIYEKIKQLKQRKSHLKILKVSINSITVEEDYYVPKENFILLI